MRKNGDRIFCSCFRVEYIGMFCTQFKSDIDKCEYIQGVRVFDTGNGFSFIDILCSLLLHCRCSCSFHVIQESRIEENSAGIMVA